MKKGIIAIIVIAIIIVIIVLATKGKNKDTAVEIIPQPTQNETPNLPNNPPTQTESENTTLNTPTTNKITRLFSIKQYLIIFTNLLLI